MYLISESNVLVNGTWLTSSESSLSMTATNFTNINIENSLIKIDW